MPLLNRLMARSRVDDGSASLEFITAGVLLLVPLVYLVIAMAAIQGASLAVEGAARQAARVYVQSRTVAEADQAATTAVSFALHDYGLKPSDAQVSVQCAPDPSVCLTRRATVAITVRVRAELPLVPPVLDLDTAASVPIEATAVQTVSRFWSSR